MRWRRPTTRPRLGRGSAVSVSRLHEYIALALREGWTFRWTVMEHARRSSMHLFRWAGCHPWDASLWGVTSREERAAGQPQADRQIIKQRPSYLCWLRGNSGFYFLFSDLGSWMYRKRLARLGRNSSNLKISVSLLALTIQSPMGLQSVPNPNSPLIFPTLIRHILCDSYPNRSLTTPGK